MNRAAFDALMKNDLFAYLGGLRDSKEAEYATNEDTLLNFRRAAAFLGMTPAQYCLTLIVKHLGGIVKQVFAGKWLWAYRTDDGGEGLKQRIADLINYLCLLFALLHEEAESRA